MTKLPATIQEAEALAYARELHVRHVEIPMFGVAYDWKSDDAGRQFARDIIKRLAQHRPEHMIEMVERARQGLSVADEALRQLILEYQDRNEKMPTYLASYAMDIVAGFKPRRRPAQRRETHFFRDIRIAVFVLLVSERFNLRPTRSPTSSRESGCSIVATVIGMNEAAVVSIWTRISRQADIRPLRSEN